MKEFVVTCPGCGQKAHVLMEICSYFPTIYRLPVMRLPGCTVAVKWNALKSMLDNMYFVCSECKHTLALSEEELLTLLEDSDVQTDEVKTT